MSTNDSLHIILFWNIFSKQYSMQNVEIDKLQLSLDHKRFHIPLDVITASRGVSVVLREGVS